MAERPRHRDLRAQAEWVPSSWGRADHLRRYGQVLSFPFAFLGSLISYPPCADRDGTVDLIFPTCESFSTSTGIGYGCSINIAYNKQTPLCASTSPGAGGLGPEKNCRSPDALCVADPDFKFNFQSSEGDDVCTFLFFSFAWLKIHRRTDEVFDPQTFVSIPLSEIIPNTSSLLLSDVSFTPPIPLSLKPGDADLDGFPDLLAIVVDSDGDAHTPRLLRNVGCSSGIPGCGADGKGRRGFKAASGNEIELLEGMRDVRGVAWVDLDEDVSRFVPVVEYGAGAGTDADGIGAGNARYSRAKDW